MSIKRIEPLPRDPRTPKEWQAAADAAWLCIALDSCRQYGLVEFDAKVDLEHCELILEKAKAKGIKPREELEL